MEGVSVIIPAHNAASELPELLRPGDLLVVNDTRVLPAHLAGVRRRGASLAPSFTRDRLKPPRNSRRSSNVQWGGTGAFTRRRKHSKLCESR